MIEGEGGIYAKVIAHSSANGVPICTMELRYPRFIHAEFMTHRMFSRNASSSRAIPVERMLEQVESDPAMPIHWGKNQPGMQAQEETNELVKEIDWGDTEQDAYFVTREESWATCASNASIDARDFSDAGYHKQIVNRLTEPFQFIKVVVTATEWDNFFALRLHEDAQPEINELARVMKEAIDQSVPMKLHQGQYHCPYVVLDITQVERIRAGEVDHIDWEVAIKCSVARCARASYNNHDGSSCSVESDIRLYDQLLAAGHMSPFEHVATPMGSIQDSFGEASHEWWHEKGVTHEDRIGDRWSGNFRSWIQYRQMV